LLALISVPPLPNYNVATKVTDKNGSSMSKQLGTTLQHTTAV